MKKPTARIADFLGNSRANFIVAVVVAIIVVGAGYLVISAAASSFAALEGEQATPVGNVSVIDDSAASGGKAIQFNAPATPPQTGACITGKHVPGSADLWGTCWPYAGNTGIPAGTTLTDYSGSCTITTNNMVFDAKTIKCDPMFVRASNVQFTRVKVIGSILVETPNSGYSFTISDSELDAGPILPGDTDDDSAIGKSNFTATRVNTYGGHRGIWCEYSCTVQDSWIHGQAPDPSGHAHESGIRMGVGSVIRHNSILCEPPDYPPDAGCSADLTGYADFSPIRNNTIDKNLFVATPGGACAYGGASTGKPFSNDPTNATYIAFTNNVFQRGTRPSDHGTYICGFYFPITAFALPTATNHNQWTDNKFDDGTAVTPQ